MGNNNIEDMDNKENDKWLQPRLFYLRSFVKPLPNTCPECGGILENLEDETICKDCDLIVSASIEYVGNTRIMLPYGRH